MAHLKAALVILFTFILYVLDVVFDIKITNKLCCADAGLTWKEIKNPMYCSMSFTLVFGSSIICNAVTFRQLLGEFRNVFMRILFAFMGVFQLLPFAWFIYCIVALCSSTHTGSVQDMMMGTVTVKMFEAIFEGVGQMCLQMYMVMEKEQLIQNIGHLSFDECLVPNTNTTAKTNGIIDTVVPQAGIIRDMVDYITYISIVLSLCSVCYTIIKWVRLQMEKPFLWIIGYTLITIIAVGSRVYLMSTIGTYWKSEQWFFINFYWLSPGIACNIASLIYTCTVPEPENKKNFRLMTFLKRSISGTCDFLSQDGLPTSVSYFLCSVIFNIMYWPNIHLKIGLFMNTFVVLLNLICSRFVKKPIFHLFFNDNVDIYEMHT